MIDLTELRALEAAAAEQITRLTAIVNRGGATATGMTKRELGRALEPLVAMRNDLPGLLDRLEKSERELHEVRSVDQRPWAEREAWDEGFAAGQNRTRFELGESAPSNPYRKNKP